MVETADGLGQHPDIRRICDLLSRPGLLKYEAAELRHLADLHGVKLQWSRYDLDSLVWSPCEDPQAKRGARVIL